MNKPIFLLLGGNKLNYGILKKFQRRGYLVYVIDWNKHPQITGDRHYQIDVKDSESIISILKKEKVFDHVIFAYSSIDLAVKSVADINRTLGLNVITSNGLIYSTSKSLMTEKWNELGLLNRFSKAYTSYHEEIEQLNRKMKLIIKPDNSSSSRGITVIEKNSTVSEIQFAFKKAYEEATNNMVVAEEFVEGIEFTVDMLGDSFGNVSVYGISRKSHTQNTKNNKIAVKLHYNAISYELQKKIADAGIACYKALGFSSSLGHLEIILKEDGTLSPVEIGARSSGFIASDLIDIVSGADYLYDLIEVQKGAKVKPGFHKQTDKSSMYFFYDFPENSSVINEGTLLDFCDKSIVSRYYDRSNIRKGKKFTKIDNDNARLGFEILEGPRNLLTIDYIKEAEKKMLAYMIGDS